MTRLASKTDYGYASRFRTQGKTLVTMMSLVCLACGVALAGVSLSVPARSAALERWSGVCLVLGLGLLGVALHGARG